MDLVWKEYVSDRLIAEHPAGFFVIRPRTASTDAQPIFCPVCEKIMSTSFDDDAHKKFQCCDSCANRWAYRDPVRWNSGWRPSLEEIRNI
jgi:hypothetical protein